jgi:hypothetical protein
VSEQLLDVSAVALRAVGDEYLVRRDVYAAVLEVDLSRLLAQERISLFRAVAVEALARRLVVDRLCIAFTTASQSGSVTSPMPSLMTFASGLADWCAATRWAISVKR